MINETNGFKEFTNDKEAENWGMKNYSQWGKKYLKDMRVADEFIKESYVINPIEFYCGEYYKWINSYLRFRVDASESKKASEMSHLLTLILSIAPRIPDDIIVYRLVNDEFIEMLIDDNKEQRYVLEKGFISTSLTKNIIKSNEYYSDYKNLLKIYVKSKTVGVYVNAVTKRLENELLLAPNAFLKLKNDPYEEDGKIVYECDLIYMNYFS